MLLTLYPSVSTVLSFSRPVRQQALLAAISEKDANIALLELSSSKRKKAQEEVMALKREKDRLMHQLKQQVNPPYLTTKIFVLPFGHRFWHCYSKQGYKFKPAADHDRLH